MTIERNGVMRDSSEAFKERFKGKTTLMNKDGHIGVATNALKPIHKSNPSDPPSQYLNSS